MRTILFTLLLLSVTGRAQQFNCSTYTALHAGATGITGFQVSGISVGKNIRLEWKTSTENNTSHFNIERSSDGTKFQYSGTTLAAGTSTVERKYSFTDFFASPGVNYYRIVSVDINENLTYSNIVVVRLNKNKNEMLLYPNPAHDKVHIVAEDDLGREINIIDIKGAVVKTHSLAKGSTAFTMDVKDLTEGTYTVTLINPDNQNAESLLLIVQ